MHCVVYITLTLITGMVRGKLVMEECGVNEGCSTPLSWPQTWFGSCFNFFFLSGTNIMSLLVRETNVGFFGAHNLGRHFSRDFASLELFSTCPVNGTSVTWSLCFQTVLLSHTKR